jgi:hypothetical protein
MHVCTCELICSQNMRIFAFACRSNGSNVPGNASARYSHTTYTRTTHAHRHTYAWLLVRSVGLLAQLSWKSVLLNHCGVSPALLSVRLCAPARDQRKRCIDNRCIVIRCIVNRCIAAVATLARSSPTRIIGRCRRSAHPPGTRSVSTWRMHFPARESFTQKLACSMAGTHKAVCVCVCVCVCECLCVPVCLTSVHILV